MMKLTSEQREGILDFARNSLDPKITCPITGYEGNSHLRYGDLYAFLNANTAEDEVHEYEEYEDWRQYYCPCEGCEKERNQIALRKIEEYMSSHCVTAESLHLVRFQDWLQQEDEDG